jgi:glycosyltransferase involved in cell wall biosynthesis
LRAGEPIVTYVARNLEPYRGFHQFMRALQIVQREHKTCDAIVVGGDGVSYGHKPPQAPNWREHMLREVSIDRARTHFVGKLPYAQYVRVLQVSAAHVYLTYPFVLSWSLLEAMACGCLVIGSDTAPVREVVRGGESGVIVDFHSADGVAARVHDALSRQVDLRPLRRAAWGAASRLTRRAGLDRLSGLLPRMRSTTLQGSNAGPAVHHETQPELQQETTMNQSEGCMAGHAARESAPCFREL